MFFFIGSLVHLIFTEYVLDVGQVRFSLKTIYPCLNWKVDTLILDVSTGQSVLPTSHFASKVVFQATLLWFNSETMLNLQLSKALVGKPKISNVA